MPQTYGLANNEKFGLVAVSQCDSAIRQQEVLPGGTLVLPDLSAVLDQQWRTWLGELRSDQIERANLVIVRHAPSTRPQILDAEHEKLSQEATDVFGLLQFSGTPSYQDAVVLKGSVGTNRLNIRGVADAKSFYRAVGESSTRVTLDRLQEAERRSLSWWQIINSGMYKRFIRGSIVLTDAVQQDFGQERLHQCVRAVEALILPTTGVTRRQFTHRCQTFTKANAAHAALLEELFNMRSDVEHPQEWDRSLVTYNPPDRLSVAERRVRQIQELATSTYRRILQNPALLQLFASDNSIAAFWAQQDGHRKRQWAHEIDLEAVQ